MKPTIVLIHGWGFDSTIWQTLTPFLEKSFTVITPDLPGFGSNLWSKGLINLEVMANDILEKTPDQATFIGWSLGGLVAMYIAIQHPERINHLITIASTPKFITTTDWPGISSWLLTEFGNNLATNYKTTLKQFVTLQFIGSNTNPTVIRQLQQRITDNPPPSKRALTDSLDVLKKTDLRYDLARIQCPQHYFFGRCDTLVPVTVCKKIKSLVRSEKTKTEILTNVSHAPFLSKPALCAKKITTALL